MTNVSIDYKASLNEAQYTAATAEAGPVLVIAGAGSGKTRTIVYRMAWLCEQGVDPHSMLLLTFTRKAAQEMLHRTAQLLERGLMGVQGGTFHAFAYTTLRQYKPKWLEGRNFSIMDSADINAAIRHCKDNLKLGKGDRSFPKVQNIVSILSKARNKECSIEDVLRKESFHLLPHCEALEQLNTAYNTFRQTQAIFDYDDLLFELEKVLQENQSDIQNLRQRFSHIMVDEYQDTNLVQARLVRLLGSEEFGGSNNVMAVGDDAQSIYAFRGANVRNILDFPKNFPNTKIIHLEENYRSTQPILNVANAILENAAESYEKHLFTSKDGGEAVRCIEPLNNKSQAEIIVRRVQELLKDHLAHEIAILFRAGFHSYDIELALNRVGIHFRKYGGLRYTDAAHIKDILSYARLLINPLDMPAFTRVADLYKGIGPKTVLKLYNVANAGDAEATQKAFAKYPNFLADIQFLDNLRAIPQSPEQYLQAIIDRYQNILEEHYPDDWPRRKQGLDEILQMSEPYQALDLFIADLVLESPEEDEQAENCITLSTIHSAKGLEWNAVQLIDLVEERFPSHHALNDNECFEEERRLMYVACTRARKHLDLYAPNSVYNKAQGGIVYTTQSPFIRQLPNDIYEQWYENYGGTLSQRGAKLGSSLAQGKRLLPKSESLDNLPSSITKAKDNTKLGYCYHKIFGRGKMLKFLPPDKYQVNFKGLGVKTILKDFLTLED